jgi:poly-beta-1,6-N-acetyl-D-glucosamine synthase
MAAVGTVAIAVLLAAPMAARMPVTAMPAAGTPAIAALLAAPMAARTAVTTPAIPAAGTPVIAALLSAPMMASRTAVTTPAMPAAGTPAIAALLAAPMAAARTAVTTPALPAVLAAATAPVIPLALGAALAFYILIGYPALLALVRGRRAAAVRKDPGFRAGVSVLLAVHNGARFIGQKLDSLLALDYPAGLMQILVVSDGSTDGTGGIVTQFASRGVQLLEIPRGGKARALNAALERATGEILFFTDVRQALDPHALSHLVANFADRSVGAATGELRIVDPDRSGEQADMGLYWRYELWARRRHSEIDSIFSTTGCIYALRRSLAEPLAPDTLTDDATFSLRAFFRGYRVIFDPEALAFDYPTAEGGEFRRKLRTLAGLWQLHLRFPRLFTGANRMRLHFLSHKFGRLALPWALLLVCAATVMLPHSVFRTGLLVAELLPLVLALLDWMVPKSFPLKKLTSPARTFLAMNLAALLSVMVFFVTPERLWRTTEVKIRP